MRALLGLIVLAAGCTPDLGAPASLVTSTRVLAVRSTGAENDPRRGDPVQLDALVAGPMGTTLMPPIRWDFCIAPKPLDENNAVADACQGDDPMRLQPIPASSPGASAPVPSNGCQLFGPVAPSPEPGQPPLRPRDPDVTGGYYQPVRAILIGGGPGGGDLYSFGLSRIRCDLANAPAADAAEYNRTYTLNINPHLASVTGKVSSASPLPLPREGMTPGGNVLGPVPAGATITVRADWTAESRESYPVWETATQSGGTGSGGKLVTHFEALRVSWFGTGGAFAHDRSGRGETETETFTEVEWKAPDAPGQVFVWAVLRDSRGGVDWGAFRIEIQ